MKTVITGTTGQIGHHLTNLLDFNKNEIALITRDASKLKNEVANQATVLEGNMLDADFMKAALAGADAYFFLPPPNFASDDMIEEYRNLATVSRDAAIANSVPRIVHLSTLGGHLDREETGLIQGQHYAEEIIRKAAPNVVHLRNGFFLENYLPSAESIMRVGQIYLPVSGESRYPFVATQDIAAIARDLLEAPTWEGRSVVEFQGQADYSFAEVAAEIGKGIGREVEHVAVPAEEAIEAMKSMGLSKAYATDLVKIFTSIDSGILKAEFPRNHAHVKTGGISISQFAKQSFPVAVG